MNEKILFTDKDIDVNLDELAKQLDSYISGFPKDEQDKVIFIGLLTGCIHFVSDLTRKIESDHNIL